MSTKEGKYHLESRFPLEILAKTEDIQLPTSGKTIYRQFLAQKHNILCNLGFLNYNCSLYYEKRAGKKPEAIGV